MLPVVSLVPQKIYFTIFSHKWMLFRNFKLSFTLNERRVLNLGFSQMTDSLSWCDFYRFLVFRLMTLILKNLKFQLLFLSVCSVNSFPRCFWWFFKDLVCKQLVPRIGIRFSSFIYNIFNLNISLLFVFKF